MPSYAIETHLLHRRRFNLEVRDDIAPEDTCLQSLHVTTNVGLRSHKMSLIHSAVRLFVPVGHDNLSSESFDLEHSLQHCHQHRLTEQRTISSVSQRVPLPFRKTSSGLSGIMLQSEKMKGWTYFM